MIANVVGMGARGPLGLSSLQVAMGIRAGLFEPRSIKLRNKRGEHIGVALTGGLSETLHGFARFVVLAAPALSEALSGLPEQLVPTEEHPVPLLLCLPEPGRPDHEPRFEDELIAAIGERSGAHIDVERSAIIDKGQPSFAYALRAAKALLDGGAVSVVVGGVDSYYHPAVFRWLEEALRLDGLHAEDGFIPSEGAAFLVLTRGAEAASSGRILDFETAEEASVASDDEPNVADAMTEILIRLQERATAPFDWAVSDINGERERSNEWDKSSSRALPPRAKFDKWVWEMGDVGAATGPLFSVVALQLCQLGAAPAARAVLALHAEGSPRGGVVVEGVERD